MSRDERRRSGEYRGDARSVPSRSVSPEPRRDRRDTYIPDREYDRDRRRERERDRSRDHYRADRPGSSRQHSNQYLSTSAGRSPNPWNPPVQGVGFYEAPSPGEVRKEGYDNPRPPLELVDGLAQCVPLPTGRSGTEGRNGGVELTNSALAVVVQQFGRREVARAIVDRLSKFAGEPVQGSARRDLDAAERDVRDSTWRLQDALASVLRSSELGGGKGDAAAGLDLDALRDRIERLERRQRSPSPLDRGKGREVEASQRPPSQPPPSLPPPPPSPPEKADHHEAIPVSALLEDDAHPDGLEGKRGRARALLEEVLRRLEEVEEKADLATLGFEDISNDVAVLETDILLQSDDIKDIAKRVTRRSRRPTTEPAAIEGDTQEGEARQERDGAEDRAGEEDMELDEESEAGAARAPVSVSANATPKPKSQTDELADEMARLREQMATVEQRLNQLQSTSTASEVVAEPTNSAPADANPPPHTAALAVPMAPNPESLSKAVTLEALTKLRTILGDMAKQLTTLQQRVDMVVSASEVEAMLEKERVNMMKQVQDAVQGILDQDRERVAKEVEEAVVARLDEHVNSVLPGLVHRELRQLAEKRTTRQEGATAMATTESNLSAQSLPVGVGAGGGPGGGLQSSAPLNSPGIPLQHRLSAPPSAQDSSSFATPQHLSQYVRHPVQRQHMPSAVEMYTQPLTQAPGSLAQRMSTDMAVNTFPSNSNPQASFEQLQQQQRRAAQAFAQQTLSPQQAWQYALPTQTMPAQSYQHANLAQQATLSRRHSEDSNPSDHSTPEFVGMSLPSTGAQQPLAHYSPTTSTQALQSANFNASGAPVLQATSTALPGSALTSSALLGSALPGSALPAAIGTGQLKVPTPQQLEKTGITPEQVMGANIGLSYKLQILGQFPGFLDRHAGTLNEMRKQEQAELATQQQLAVASAAQQGQHI